MDLNDLLKNPGFSAVMDVLKEGVIITDLNGKIMYSNIAYRELCGIDDEAQLIGENAFKFVAPEEISKTQANLTDLMKTGHIKPTEYSIINKTGERAYVEMSGFMVNGEQQENQTFIAIMRDVTERKLAKEQKRRYSVNDMFVDVLLLRLGQVYTSIGGDNRAWIVALEQIAQQPIRMLEEKFYYKFFPEGKITLEEYGKGICSFLNSMGMDVTYELDGNKLNLYNSECPWDKNRKHPLSCILTRGIITKFATKALGDAVVEGGDTIMQGYSKCTFKVKQTV